MIVQSREEMEKIAREIAGELRLGDVVCLSGELGAGKTTWARALIRAWLEDEDVDVPSPSFTLVQSYQGQAGMLYHFDLYRLGAQDELFELGIPEIFVEGISLIEWPDRLGSEMPKQRIEISIHDLGGEKRDMNIKKISENG